MVEDGGDVLVRLPFCDLPDRPGADAAGYRIPVFVDEMAVLGIAIGLGGPYHELHGAGAAIIVIIREKTLFGDDVDESELEQGVCIPLRPVGSDHRPLLPVGPAHVEIKAVVVVRDGSVDQIPAHGPMHDVSFLLGELIDIVVGIEHDDPAVRGQDTPPLAIALEQIGEGPGDAPVHDQIECIVGIIEIVGIHLLEFAYHAGVLRILSRLLQHLPGHVDSGDIMAEAGQTDGKESGAGSDIKYSQSLLGGCVIDYLPYPLVLYPVVCQLLLHAIAETDGGAAPESQRGFLCLFLHIKASCRSLAFSEVRSSEDHERRIELFVPDDPAMYSVDGFDILLCDDLRRFADHVNYARRSHHYDLVSVLGGDVEIVADHNHRDVATFGHRTEQFREIDLVADVQVRSGLVQNKDLGSLDKAPGDSHSL